MSTACRMTKGWMRTSSRSLSSNELPPERTGLQWDMFESSFTEDNNLGFLFPYFVTSEMQLNKESLRIVFDRIDTDGNGVLDHDELCRGFENKGIIFTSDTITGLMEIADSNGDGVIQYEEFEALMNRLWKEHNIDVSDVGHW